MAKDYISGTGMTITKHAISRWLERDGEELSLFCFEAALAGALKQNNISVRDLRGNRKIVTQNHTFVTRNRIVITYYKTNR